MRIFFFFARKYPWESLLMLLCLVLGALAEGIGISTFLPLISMATSLEGETGWEVAEAAQPSELEEAVRGTLERLGFEPSIGLLLVIIVAAMWIKGLLVLVANRQVGYTVAHVATDLRLELLRALLGARWAYYTRQSVGAVANSMATEADRASLAYNHMAQVAAFLIETALYAGIAIAVSWHAALAAAVAGAFIISALNVLVRMAGRAGRRQTKLLRSLLGRLTDSLNAVKMLKAMGRETQIGPMLEEETKLLKRTLRRRVFSREAMKSLQEPILVAFMAAGLFVALTRWNMAASTVIVLALLFLRTLGGLNKAQRKYQQMVTEGSALWSLRELTQSAQQHLEMRGGTALPSLERGIELRGVGVDYDGKRILAELDLEIPAGQITALIGPSGAGKTTIADLVTGLVSPDAGEVRIDGTPLAELDLRHWRQMIGYVPQEMLLLHHTVRFNVTLGDPEIGAEQVEEALRAAGAWGFVCALPQGMDTSVGERGSLMSGGQRQRISIARALLRRPKLLILDEATAALDEETEKAIWSALARLRGRTTILAISHQPTLKEAADRVYQVENARARPLPQPAAEAAAARASS